MQKEASTYLEFGNNNYNKQENGHRYLLVNELQKLPMLFNITTYQILKLDIMYTTYHLTSAQDVSTDILDAIKATFKSKPITIIVEEDDSNFELTADMKAVLDQRLQEDESTYLSAEESIKQLKKKHGL